MPMKLVFWSLVAIVGLAIMAFANFDYERLDAEWACPADPAS
jgi:hypothetical protein